MNKLSTFALLSSALVGSIGFAAESVTLHVAPERDVVLNGASQEVLVEIELEGRKTEHAERSP